MKLIKRIQDKLDAAISLDEAADAAEAAANVAREADIAKLKQALAGLQPETEDLIITAVKEHLAEVAATMVSETILDPLEVAPVAMVAAEVAGDAAALDQTDGDGTEDPVVLAAVAQDEPETPSLG